MFAISFIENGCKNGGLLYALVQTVSIVTITVKSINKS